MTPWRGGGGAAQPGVGQSAAPPASAKKYRPAAVATRRRLGRRRRYDPVAQAPQRRQRPRPPLMVFLWKGALLLPPFASSPLAAPQRSLAPTGPVKSESSGKYHSRAVLLLYGRTLPRRCTVRTQYYLSTPIRGQCARLPRLASHKPRLLLPHYKGAFVGEEDQHPVVGPRPAVPRPRGVCPCWQTRKTFLAGERDDNQRLLTAFCIV